MNGVRNILLAIVLVFGAAIGAAAGDIEVNLPDGRVAVLKDDKTWAIKPPPETVLQEIWNRDACSLLGTVSAQLPVSSDISRIVTWYRWGDAQTTTPASLYDDAGVQISSGLLTRGGCDAFQKNWCEAEYKVSQRLEAGLYYLQAVPPRICGNAASGGQGFIRLYAKGAESASALPAPRSEPERSPPTLAVTPQSLTPNDAVTVRWTDLSGAAQDWVSIVDAGAPDDTYVQGRWAYTGGATTGSREFPPLPAGEYEARVYFDWPKGGYQVQARAAFTVEPQSMTPEPSKKNGDLAFEDMRNWRVDYGPFEATAHEVAAQPAGDGHTSYYLAPGALLGDWRGRSALIFEKKSWGGSYYGTGSYGSVGDVVIESGDKRAVLDIPKDHSGEWRRYEVSLSEGEWRLSGGAGSLSDILSHVTSFRIRAEYGAGTDYSNLRGVAFVGRLVSAPQQSDRGPLAVFQKFETAGISGYNDRSLSGVTVQDCARACLDAKTFYCKTFDFGRGAPLNECYLSSVDRKDVPSAYVDDYSSYDHYVRIDENDQVRVVSPPSSQIGQKANPEPQRLDGAKAPQTTGGATDKTEKSGKIWKRRIIDEAFADGEIVSAPPWTLLAGNVRVLGNKTARMTPARASSASMALAKGGPRIPSLSTAIALDRSIPNVFFMDVIATLRSPKGSAPRLRLGVVQGKARQSGYWLLLTAGNRLKVELLTKTRSGWRTLNQATMDRSFTATNGRVRIQWVRKKGGAMNLLIDRKLAFRVKDKTFQDAFAAMVVAGDDIAVDLRRVFVYVTE